MTFDAFALVSMGSAGPWETLAQLPRCGDPRYNEFDWESWYESELFRARVEQKLKP